MGKTTRSLLLEVQGLLGLTCEGHLWLRCQASPWPCPGSVCVWWGEPAGEECPAQKLAPLLPGGTVQVLMLGGKDVCQGSTTLGAGERIPQGQLARATQGTPRGEGPMPLLGIYTPDSPRSRQALWGAVSWASGGKAALEGGRPGVCPEGSAWWWRVPTRSQTHEHPG